MHSWDLQMRTKLSHTHKSADNAANENIFLRDIELRVKKICGHEHGENAHNSIWRFSRSSSSDQHFDRFSQLHSAPKWFHLLNSTPAPFSYNFYRILWSPSRVFTRLSMNSQFSRNTHDERKNILHCKMSFENYVISNLDTFKAQTVEWRSSLTRKQT